MAISGSALAERVRFNFSQKFLQHLVSQTFLHQKPATPWFYSKNIWCRNFNIHEKRSRLRNVPLRNGLVAIFLKFFCSILFLTFFYTRNQRRRNFILKIFGLKILIFMKNARAAPRILPFAHFAIRSINEIDQNRALLRAPSLCRTF